MTLILKDQPSIKGVRFSVSKEFWRGYEFYDTLNDRIRWRMRLGLDSHGGTHKFRYIVGRWAPRHVCGHV